MPAKLLRHGDRLPARPIKSWFNTPEGNLGKRLRRIFGVCLESLLRELGGPRRIRTDVGQSKQIEAPQASKLSLRKMLNVLQANIAFKACRAYRTISFYSTLILSRVLRIDISVREASLLYEVKRRKQLGYVCVDRELKRSMYFCKLPYPAHISELGFESEKDLDQTTMDRLTIVGLKIYTDGKSVILRRNGGSRRRSKGSTIQKESTARKAVRRKEERENSFSERNHQHVAVLLSGNRISNSADSGSGRGRREVGYRNSHSLDETQLRKLLLFMSVFFERMKELEYLMVRRGQPELSLTGQTEHRKLLLHVYIIFTQIRKVTGSGDEIANETNIEIGVNVTGTGGSAETIDFHMVRSLHIFLASPTSIDLFTQARRFRVLKI
ncbi:hypothetical protein EVAR_48584_1 [Eumeta japonica]|uniref:Uncharacterized protein n=1 Tax=Eumeta variegata TaxID=151549 RepID=A0A4C1XFV4_EUMVA|nr:hypothetical protein EVAR_48584_1 [Eumeta japonica]